MPSCNEKELDALVLFRLIKKSDRDRISCSLPAVCENFLGCLILFPCLHKIEKLLMEFGCHMDPPQSQILLN